MNREKICIIADCTCDLSEELLKHFEIDRAYFYIHTDSGRFRDVDEITAANIFEYMQDEGKCGVTVAPYTEDLVSLYRSKLQTYDEVIHIITSSKISMCLNNAMEAITQLGDSSRRVHLFDSRQLSSGIGLLCLRAAALRKEGLDSDTILSELEKMRDRVSTTFMAPNADYLYINKRVNQFTKILCNLLFIHPVLEIKDGDLRLKSIRLGNYEQSMKSYINKELQNINNIRTDQVFVTHAGCTANDLKLIRSEVEQFLPLSNVTVTEASATVSSNSGPRTFGVLFVKK